MLVGNALDEPLTFQRVEAIHGRLVRDDLAGCLNLADQRGLAMLAQIASNVLVQRLLLLCKGGH